MPTSKSKAFLHFWYFSIPLAFCYECSLSNNRSKEITPPIWLSTTCEFLFASYRQQHFYPWLSSSCSSESESSCTAQGWQQEGLWPIPNSALLSWARSQGTHTGRSQRFWFPLPRAYCCTKNRGRSSAFTFAPVLLTSPGPLYLLHLYTAGYKYHLIK